MLLQAKLDVRNSRKKTLDEVKKLKGSISEDESKRFTKEVLLSPLLVLLDSSSYDCMFLNLVHRWKPSPRSPSKRLQSSCPTKRKRSKTRKPATLFFRI